MTSTRGAPSFHNPGGEKEMRGSQVKREEKIRKVQSPQDDPGDRPPAGPSPQPPHPEPPAEPRKSKRDKVSDSSVLGTK